ncbi:MAG TPA: zinc-binding dehydrogenase [Gaiellaceae bacterium]|nr:zinc-binding dehydrogenase [Gaiellaceae bacterium]
MRIRAAVLEEFGSPLAVQELDLAEPRAGEVLVRLAACGVCHTDLYTASGADPSGYAPTVLGHEGAERIVAVDRSESRLELARGQGATDVLAAGEETVARIVEMTGGFGADYTFEATGLVAVMRQAVESARMGWGLATVCGVAGRGETLDVVPRFLITGRRVAGSSFGGVKGRDGVPALVDRWLAGEIDVAPLISHRLTLDDVNRGFELMEAQDGIRSVIAFDV